MTSDPSLLPPRPAGTCQHYVSYEFRCNDCAMLRRADPRAAASPPGRPCTLCGTDVALVPR
jgi:hypothetical protein